VDSAIRSFPFESTDHGRPPLFRASAFRIRIHGLIPPGLSGLRFFHLVLCPLSSLSGRSALAPSRLTDDSVQTSTRYPPSFSQQLSPAAPPSSTASTCPQARDIRSGGGFRGEGGSSTSLMASDARGTAAAEPSLYASALGRRESFVWDTHLAFRLRRSSAWAFGLPLFSRLLGSGFALCFLCFSHMSRFALGPETLRPSLTALAALGGRFAFRVAQQGSRYHPLVRGEATGLFGGDLSAFHRYYPDHPRVSAWDQRARLAGMGWEGTWFGMLFHGMDNLCCPCRLFLSWFVWLR